MNKELLIKELSKLSKQELLQFLKLVLELELRDLNKSNDENAEIASDLTRKSSKKIQALIMTYASTRAINILLSK